MSVAKLSSNKMDFISCAYKVAFLTSSHNSVLFSIDIHDHVYVVYAIRKYFGAASLHVYEL